MPQSRDESDPNAQAHPLTRSPAHPLTQCPLCRGALEHHEGLYRCLGRCCARWLEDSPGRLVDLSALPYGICGCCRPPRALVRSASASIVCPISGRAHLLLPGGASVPADALPYGTCPCCHPPMPLIAEGDTLACLARPEQRYRRDGDRLMRIAPTPGAAETLESIDAALRHNSARLTVNGLFDLD